jgi:hypothetical protein
VRRYADTPDFGAFGFFLSEHLSVSTLDRWNEILVSNAWEVCSDSPRSRRMDKICQPIQPIRDVSDATGRHPSNPNIALSPRVPEYRYP